MRRNVWGRIADDQDWRLRAACRKVDPEIFFKRPARPTALHICRSHCPVMVQCRQYTLARPPTDTVQGGIIWRNAGGSNGARPAPLHQNIQPTKTCQLCPTQQRRKSTQDQPDEPSPTTGKHPAHGGVR